MYPRRYPKARIFLVLCSLAMGGSPAVAGALTDAIKQRDVALVRSLVAAGEDVHEKVLGDYPLNVAALFGPAETVAVLLAAGAEIERPGRDGMRPLHHAVLSGRREIVALLLANGAQVDAQNRKGSTPLHRFVCSGGTNPDIARMLLAAGADPNKTDDGEQMPSLRCAGITGDVGLGKLLIEADANVNQGDEGGRTALHAAAFYLHHDFARMLLAAGADVNQASATDHTPLFVTPDDPEMRKILTDAGAR
jgi:ankyrin repeat protein